MDFERELKKVADGYAGQGYKVVVHPKPEDLPPFAKDFKVEIVGKRGAHGVLVSVKRNREEMAADDSLPRYAEVAGAQQDWRFDFVILEAENPIAREVRGADEPAEEQITKVLSTARNFAEQGHLEPALITAWAGLEAAMRRRLQAAGEKAGWGTMPREMITELFSAGALSPDEFPRLEMSYRLRSQIAHGFVPQHFDAGYVQFIIDTARRLLEESHNSKKTA
jgi:hypothetical protein